MAPGQVAEVAVQVTSQRDGRRWVNQDVLARHHCVDRETALPNRLHSVTGHIVSQYSVQVLSQSHDCRSQRCVEGTSLRVLSPQVLNHRRVFEVRWRVVELEDVVNYPISRDPKNQRQQTFRNRSTARDQRTSGRENEFVTCVAQRET